MEDYTEEIRELIGRYYSPIATTDSWACTYKSTLELLTMVVGVIPTTPVSEHDIYELMKEIGFAIELVEQEQGEAFLWKLYKKSEK
nr:MAG TPA: hypothetical protein [Caudoviricetes sp.]